MLCLSVCLSVLIKVISENFGYQNFGNSLTMAYWWSSVGWTNPVAKFQISPHCRRIYRTHLDSYFVLLQTCSLPGVRWSRLEYASTSTVRLSNGFWTDTGRSALSVTGEEVAFQVIRTSQFVKKDKVRIQTLVMDMKMSCCTMTWVVEKDLGTTPPYMLQRDITKCQKSELKSPPPLLKVSMTAGYRTWCPWTRSCFH